MRKILWIPALLFLASCLLLPASSFAQNFTVVSATVVDPAGLPYAFASVQVQLIPTGVTPTLNGLAVSAFARGTADATGTFSITLASNAVLLPPGTQWQFTVNESPGIAPPLGAGPQTIVATITISGASQNISATLQAAAPALTSITLGTFGGVIENTQVAVGTAHNTIGSDGNLIWGPSEEDPPRKKLTVQGSQGVLRPYNYTNALNSTWSIDFSGHQANAATALFGDIQQTVIANTNGAVSGQFDIHTMNAGVSVDALKLSKEGNATISGSLSLGSGAAACGAASSCDGYVGAATEGTPTVGQFYQRWDSVTGGAVCSLSGGPPTNCNPLLPSSSTNNDCAKWSGTNGRILADAGVACGGGGAPGGVVIVTKVATYAGAAGDFSSSSAAPSQVIFTLTGTGQTYTLIAPSPATGSCVIVENSLASAPFILGILTGAALTLDGVAYTTASSSLALGPGQSRWYCSDGTNYRSQPGYGVAQTMTANIAGTWFPIFPGNENTGVTSGANVVQTFTFVLDHTAKISNITVGYTVGVAASVGDAGIYDSSGNLLTHVSGGFVTTNVSGTQVKSAASPVVTLPPGTYTVGMCDSSTTVSFVGNVINGQVALISSASGSLIGPGTAANACTVGVLPATSGAITIANVLNTVPIFLGTP